MSGPSDAALAAVTIQRDIVYGQGSIGHGTATPGVRDLLLDAYLPDEGSGQSPGTGLRPALRPALLMSHGGAYHRGSKTSDLFEQDGFCNTPVTEYCQRWAARGWVCFSIGYRLTQERGAPQAQPIRRDRRTLSRGRIDHVRGLLGLPPASDEELINGVEAAISDVAQAFRFVQANAARWGIAAQRIALGGFSAGAFSSVYAACALGVPAAAIVSLSGGMDADDAAHYLQAGRQQPPLLLFSSEFDLPGIPERTLNLANRAEQLGLGLRRYHVPGRPHFYDRQSEAHLVQATLPGGPEHCTVDEAINDFLAQALALTPMGR